jgi:hypothetical protein
MRISTTGLVYGCPFWGQKNRTGLDFQTLYKTGRVTFSAVSAQPGPSTAQEILAIIVVSLFLTLISFFKTSSWIFQTRECPRKPETSEDEQVYIFTIIFSA